MEMEETHLYHLQKLKKNYKTMSKLYIGEELIIDPDVKLEKVELTLAEYEALSNKKDNVLYVITDAINPIEDLEARVTKLENNSGNSGSSSSVPDSWFDATSYTVPGDNVDLKCSSTLCLMQDNWQFMVNGDAPSGRPYSITIVHANEEARDTTFTLDLTDLKQISMSNIEEPTITLAYGEAVGLTLEFLGFILKCTFTGKYSVVI